MTQQQAPTLQLSDLTQEHLAWLSFAELLSSNQAVNVRLIRHGDNQQIKFVELTAYGADRSSGRGRYQRITQGSLVDAIGAVTNPKEVKRCPRCKQYLNLESFCIARSRPDGRQWQCKQCAVKRGSEERKLAQAEKRIKQELRTQQQVQREDTAPLTTTATRLVASKLRA